MSEQQQQQQVTSPKSGALTKLLTVLLPVVAGCIIFWFGWGKDMMQAEKPKAASTPPATAPVAAPVAQPAIPTGPRPTIGAPPARPGALKFFVSGRNFFDFGRTYFLVIHYNQGWTGVDQQKNFKLDAGYPKAAGDTWEMNGTWTPAGVPFAWKQTIKQLPGNAATFEVSVKSDQPVQTNALALGINMPPELYSGQTLIIDGQPLKLNELPATRANATLFGPKVISRLEIATASGNIAIEGPVSMLIQDNRAYGGDVFYIRLGFTPESGMISEASLKLTFREIP